MKKGLQALAALCCVALGIQVFTAPVGADSKKEKDKDYLNNRIDRGYDIAPVPLKTQGLDRDLVGLGSYLVNTGGCNDCHTNPSFVPGGDPFFGQPEQINTEGYLSGGTPFGPDITSRNLTPRASSGRPAGLTLAQFTEVLRKGSDFKNRHPQISPLLQVMPWPVIGKLLDQDIEAMYEYLRAIPCLPDVNSPTRCVA